LPIIGSPLFIISNPKLVIAQCIAGVVGSMPALNAHGCFHGSHGPAPG
jgi:nitronate monooxygenase